MLLEVKNVRLDAEGRQKEEPGAAQIKGEMVGCRGQTCARAGCPRSPCYGVKGSRTREFCSSHAPAGMVNVCHKTCVHEGCSKRPTYGVREVNRKEFCEAHSEPGMVNLNTRCCRKGCYRMAGFGFRRKLCLHHNELEMACGELVAARVKRSRGLEFIRRGGDPHCGLHSK